MDDILDLQVFIVPYHNSLHYFQYSNSLSQINDKPTTNSSCSLLDVIKDIQRFYSLEIFPLDDIQLFHLKKKELTRISKIDEIIAIQYDDDIQSFITFQIQNAIEICLLVESKLSISIGKLSCQSISMFISLLTWQPKVSYLKQLIRHHLHIGSAIDLNISNESYILFTEESLSQIFAGMKVICRLNGNIKVKVLYDGIVYLIDFPIGQTLDIPVNKNMIQAALGITYSISLHNVTEMHESVDKTIEIDKASKDYLHGLIQMSNCVVEEQEVVMIRNMNELVYIKLNDHKKLILLVQWQPSNQVVYIPNDIEVEMYEFIISKIQLGNLKDLQSCNIEIKDSTSKVIIKSIQELISGNVYEISLCSLQCHKCEQYVEYGNLIPINCSTNHIVCRQCYQRHIEDSIANELIPTCLICSDLLIQDDIEANLLYDSMKLKESINHLYLLRDQRLQQYQQSFEISTKDCLVMYDSNTCPYCNHENVLLIETKISLNDDIIQLSLTNIISCSNCHISYCRYCRISYHHHCNCKEYINKLKRYISFLQIHRERYINDLIDMNTGINTDMNTGINTDMNTDMNERDILSYGRELKYLLHRKNQCGISNSIHIADGSHMVACIPTHAEVNILFELLDNRIDYETKRSKKYKKCPHCLRENRRYYSIDKVTCGVMLSPSSSTYLDKLVVVNGCGKTFSWDLVVSDDDIDLDFGLEEDSFQLSGLNSLLISKSMHYLHPEEKEDTFHCDVCHTQIVGMMIRCVQCSDYRICLRCSLTTSFQTYMNGDNCISHVFEVIC